jgi:hypothetical protein
MVLETMKQRPGLKQTIFFVPLAAFEGSTPTEANAGILSNKAMADRPPKFPPCCERSAGKKSDGETATGETAKEMGSSNLESRI